MEDTHIQRTTWPENRPLPPWYKRQWRWRTSKIKLSDFLYFDWQLQLTATECKMMCDLGSDGFTSLSQHVVEERGYVQWSEDHPARWASHLLFHSHGYQRMGFPYWIDPHSIVWGHHDSHWVERLLRVCCRLKKNRVWTWVSLLISSCLVTCVAEKPTLKTKNGVCRKLSLSENRR